MDIRNFSKRMVELMPACIRGFHSYESNYLSRGHISLPQFWAMEYLSRKGWGHACIRDVMDLAIRASVKNLRLFHHDPTHSDDFLDELLKEARGLAVRANSPIEIAFASEGEVVVLTDSPA